MKTQPLNQRGCRRAPMTTSPGDRIKSRLSREQIMRETEDCLVGRFSTRLPRALPGTA